MNDVSYIINNAKACGAAAARDSVLDHYIRISTTLNDNWYGMDQEEREKVNLILQELKSVLADLDKVVDKFAC